MKSTVGGGGGGGREMLGSEGIGGSSAGSMTKVRNQPRRLVPLRVIPGETQSRPPIDESALQCRALWQSAISKADGK
jgi:hypothetical protein